MVSKDKGGRSIVPLIFALSAVVLNCSLSFFVARAYVDGTLTGFSREGGGHLFAKIVCVADFVFVAALFALVCAFAKKCRRKTFVLALFFAYFVPILFQNNILYFFGLRAGFFSIWNFMVLLENIPALLVSLAPFGNQVFMCASVFFALNAFFCILVALVPFRKNAAKCAGLFLILLQTADYCVVFVAAHSFLYAT